MLVCVYCNREVKSDRSKQQHEIRCKFNPNHIIVKPSYGMSGKKGSNQHTKGTFKGISNETREKLSAGAKNQKWNDERKAKHSEVMKKAVFDNPESYTSSNRGRTKQFEVDGIKFQGKWELEFYNYCKSNNITIERSNEWFEYEWNGTRKYFPDFYLKDKNIYIEVKGFETERDVAKWSAFPHTLRIIRKQDIVAIRKGKIIDL